MIDKDKESKCGTELEGSWPDCFAPTTLPSDGSTIPGLPFSMEEGPCMCPYCVAEREGKAEEGQPVIGIVVPPNMSETKTAFVKDLSEAMIQIGGGHDPYNYIGSFVITRMLGISD